MLAFFFRIFRNFINIIVEKNSLALIGHPVVNGITAGQIPFVLVLDVGHFLDYDGLD